jgi:hypothetical protein
MELLIGDLTPQELGELGSVEAPDQGRILDVLDDGLILPRQISVQRFDEMLFRHPSLLMIPDR